MFYGSRVLFGCNSIEKKLFKFFFGNTNVALLQCIHSTANNPFDLERINNNLLSYGACLTRAIIFCANENIGDFRFCYNFH